MSKAADASVPALEFDLYVSTGPARLVWGFRDHKVRLVDDRIVWTVDGRPLEAKLDDIAEIHLTAGGGVMSGDGSPAYMRVVAGRQRPYPSFCRIHLRNGGLLRVMDSGSSGLGDANRAEAYSEFVVRLHERLAARARGPITLSAGYSPVRYRILQVALGLMGFLTLGALIALILGARPHHFLALIAGMIAFGFQVAMVRRNAPQTYDLAHVPDRVLPARVARHASSGPWRGAAPAVGEPPPAQPSLHTRASPDLNPRLVWGAVAVVVLGIAAWIGWEAGLSETARMLEPGEAPRALAAVEAKAGGPLRLHGLEVTPHALTLSAEASAEHIDRQGLVSHVQTWTVTHITFYSGYREWDEVSGPTDNEGLPTMMEATTKLFTARPDDLADLPAMQQTAIAHAGLAGPATVTEMALTQQDFINPIAGRDPLQWQVSIAAPGETAEITLDRKGGYIEGDYTNTRRVRDIDLLAGGKPLDDLLGTVRGKIADTPVNFVRITEKQVDLRTEDKRYIADAQGIVDRTPQFFYCHAVMDIMAGRFPLGVLNSGALLAIQDRARTAAQLPQARTDAVSLAMPPMTMDSPPPGPLWTVALKNGASQTRVVFSRTGEIVRIDRDKSPDACD